MELFIQYFIFIKILFYLLLIWVGYKAFKSNSFKSSWAIAFYTLLVFFVINPVKMDVNTAQQTTYTNTKIEQSKILPPKITDNTFKENVNSVEGITEKDLP